MGEPFHDLSQAKDNFPKAAQPSESSRPRMAEDYDPDALAAFWVAHFLSGEKLEGLRTVYIDSVHYGPERAIQGVRNPFDPSVNDDESPTVLVFDETDAKARTRRVSVSWE